MLPGPSWIHSSNLSSITDMIAFSLELENTLRLEKGMTVCFSAIF